MAGSTREVFTAFLRLGLTAFGGPIAHLGYFRTEFVERRRWLTDEQYAQLMALCQFLPGFLRSPACCRSGSVLRGFTAQVRSSPGVNAAVVGLLAAALYDPIGLQGIETHVDPAIALIGFSLLATGRVSAIWVVLWCVTASVATKLVLPA